MKTSKVKNQVCAMLFSSGFVYVQSIGGKTVKTVVSTEKFVPTKGLDEVNMLCMYPFAFKI